MRKRFRVLILAAVVVAVVVPLAVALSVETSDAVVQSGVPGEATVVAMTTSAGGGTLVRTTAVPLFAGLPDGARLLLLGAFLFALAAGIKRASYGPTRPLISAPEAYNRDTSVR